MKRLIVLTGALVALVVLPSTLWATNGYFAHGYGTASKGMAGAGAALAQDAIAPATNPAGIAFLTPRVDVSLALFNPNRDYRVIGSPSGAPGTFGLAPGKVESQSRYFAIPSIGMVRSFGSDQMLGVAAFGNGGMNTDYHASSFGGGPTGVDLMQLFMTPTYARRLNASHAIGASAVLGFQRFKAAGLAAFGNFSSDAASLTNNGYAGSYGAGVRLGYVGHLTHRLSVAASYQSRTWMSKFGAYSGLFCESGDFDVPSSMVAGLAVKPLRRMDVAVDVQRINYSEIHSIGHPMFPNLAQEPLGMHGSAGFGWNDVTTVKIGTQVHAGPLWTLRGGYSVGNQPVPSSEVLFNILAPGVVEQHATLGFTRLLAGERTLSMSLMRAFSNTVTGPNPLEVPGQQQIALRMDEWELEVGYGFGH
jgi:long-chain fatty acid transport protein